ncbi:TPR-like protein, partial [Suillus occidentalis]
DKKQQLVLSIIDFLNQSIDDGTVKQDDREGLEVAIQCIGEAFGVDPLDDKQRERLNIKPAKLQTIFDVFLKTRDKVVSSPSTPSAPSADAKAKAEKLKQTGNTHMTVKKYDEAIDAYTKAIALDSANPVYYSNRAAAYASKGDHASAILDSEKAIEVDPKFVKAYSRLGHAQYTLGDYKAAAAAFKKGVELDPTNANLKSGLQNALDRIPSDDDDDDDGPPPLVPEGDIPLSNARAGPGAGAAGLGGMADMFRNMGGMGSAGGMPDLASLMNNPMMMQMAQQMMANGGMERLMSNPNVANMMNRMQSGGATPSMEELMADPELRNL